MTALLAACLGMPSALHAHEALERSIPARGAHLSAAPRQLRLTFTERPELTFTRLRLLGPGNASVALGALSLDSVRTVVASINGPLTGGTYTVVWQVAGADGHPVRGQYTFTIAPGATGLGAAYGDTTAASPRAGERGATVPAPGQPPLPPGHHDAASMPSGGDFGAESPAYVALRWAQYTALLLVLGALAFHYLVLGFLRRRQNPDSPMLPAARARAATIGLWAAAALGVTTLLRLYAQSYAMHGPADALDAGLIGTMLQRTTWGWGWLLQVVGVFLALGGFARARRAPGEDGAGPHRAGWALAALGALALAFTPALSGHASAAPKLTGLAVVSDALHVIGAGGWLGSLLFVLAAGIPAAMRLHDGERGQAVANLINAFSPTALIFAGIAATTGVFAAWIHLGSVPALWQSSYGQTLLLKLAILSVVAGTGAYNWLRVRPALGDVKGAERIRRSATVELGVGVLVLVVTAVLVAMPTPMDMNMTEEPVHASGTAPVSPTDALSPSAARPR